jgi:DNA helicase-2/ATP-dependent DNA helicase PcrA
MDTDAILDGLNPSQKEAAQNTGGPQLIVAGPGSGKTRVITHRIAYLVRTLKVPPWRICAVTFTNKAARELKERLSQLLGPTLAGDLNASTFHALCARILRQDGSEIGLDRNFVIYDQDDQIDVVKRAIDLVDLDPKKYPPRSILSKISYAKSQLQDAAVFRTQVRSYQEEIVERIYTAYQGLLTQSQAVDFDDLILRTHHLFRDHAHILERYQDRFHYLHVDEFQDTNLAQYAIARQLSGNRQNICVVGDPDQSIYSWRNADIRNILNFQRDFPSAHVVHLGENYRSTPFILDAAQGVISTNRQRLPQRLTTVKSGGFPVVEKMAQTEEDEAKWVVQEVQRLVQEEQLSLGGVAVTYRVNAQSRAFEEACLMARMNHRVVGAQRFYHRKEVKDMIAYLRLLSNHADDVSLLRIINLPARGIGQKSLDGLVSAAVSQGTPLYSTIAQICLDKDVLIVSPIPQAGQSAMERFHELIEGLTTDSKSLELPELLEAVMERSGYRKLLEEEGATGEERLGNLGELRAVAVQFTGMTPEEGLGAFLEKLALVTDTDNLGDESNSLTLITLHQIKGLEFPVVFVVGMEENLLPHKRSLDDPEEMEEERRLCYVGMTRAQERLYLVRAKKRTIWGQSTFTLASRFLRDIPRDKLILALGEPDLSSARDAEINEPAYPELQEISPFAAGEHVIHPIFGEGIVLSCSDTRGDYQVTVVFSSGEVKKLLSSMAKLQTKY